MASGPSSRKVAERIREGVTVAAGWVGLEPRPSGAVGARGVVDVGSAACAVGVVAVGSDEIEGLLVCAARRSFMA